MTHCRLGGVLALTMLVTAPAWGQIPSPGVVNGISELEQQIQDTRTDQTRVEQSRRQAADAWGLSEQEYRRFESLMEGPRGTWSPNLDPLTALGIEARSDAERQKYAELMVETERERVEAELAFQRAYDAAWQRLYPNAMPVNAFSTKGGADASQSVFGNNSRASSQRLNVVVAIEGCDSCDATVKRLLGAGAAMDIWVVDSSGDDSRIRRWAAKLGVSPDRVRAGDITLNHGGAINVDSADLPRVAPRGG
ncbi:TIGR03759 family integrating conjugative element protein [Pistricoccus aurantiacus]|uniref:TIGR03759 family integrating conjugative element protein n=1 Tax=Pistricoccus aurantiacus TaxID=1883414 RepID=A0A5B8SNB4_9GAMM|nr:TIGR03759 family integrating conjugative element protein [Pistricoccus aurantiacus]QEA38632.1 TIGR03759 family integrating conjugative element protein [Pistricoccus aurantiacus]